MEQTRSVQLAKIPDPLTVPQSTLMNLPKELRLLIWEHLFAGHEVNVKYERLHPDYELSESSHPKEPHLIKASTTFIGEVSRVSKLIKSEIPPIFFKNSTFHLSYPAEGLILDQISMQHFGKMKHINGDTFLGDLIFKDFRQSGLHVFEMDGVRQLSYEERRFSYRIYKAIRSTCENLKIKFPYVINFLSDDPPPLGGVYEYCAREIKAFMDEPKEYELILDVILYCGLTYAGSYGDDETSLDFVLEQFRFHPDGNCELMFLDHEAFSYLESTLKIMGLNAEKAKDQVSRCREEQKSEDERILERMDQELGLEYPVI